MKALFIVVDNVEKEGQKYDQHNEITGRTDFEEDVGGTDIR